MDNLKKRIMMKTPLLLSLLFCSLAGVLQAQTPQKDTLFVADYGIRPYSYENQTGDRKSVV